MKKKVPSSIQKALHCDLPRKQEAIEALLSLAWKKERKFRPDWLLDELNSYL